MNFTRRGASDKKLMPKAARQLLEAGLWGVPPTAQAKDKIAAGDRVLAFVGAPDRLFIGHATVTAPWHEWTPDEAARYAKAGTFKAGIAVADAVIWARPLPLEPVWSTTQAAKSNPKARWYGAVASLSLADFDLIVGAGTASSGGTPATPPTPAAATTPTLAQPAGTTPATQPGAVQTSPSPSGLPESDDLFSCALQVRAFAASPKPINEEGTRAFFINKQLDALGYTSFDDVEHGSVVASGNFPDYVLRSHGRPVIAVEAKKFGHPLGPKEAAQLVGYGSVLGLRWGVLTDGRYIQVYDMPVTGVQPHDRLIVSVDLADFVDRDDFDTRIWPIAALLTKEAMQSGADIERYAARELIRTLLTDGQSAPIEALRKELQQRKVVLSRAAVAALVNDLIG